MALYGFTTIADPRIHVGHLLAFHTVKLAHRHACHLAANHGQDVHIYEVQHINNVLAGEPAPENIDPRTPMATILQGYAPLAALRYGPGATIAQVLATALMAIVKEVADTDPHNFIEREGADDSAG